MYNSFAKFIALAILAIIIVSFSLNPQTAPLKPDLTFQTILAALGSIFVIILLVERVTEIVITIWRQSGAEKLSAEIDLLTGDTAKASELLTKQKELAGYKADTKSIALLVGFSLSVVLCAAGVGLLGAIIEIDTTKPNAGLLRGVDIILTAGLIAGGSDGFHQFVSTLEAFFYESKKRIQNNS